MARSILAAASICALFLCCAFAAQKAVPKADASHPEIIEKVAPKYPAEAKNNKVAGEVVLEIRIAPDGRVIAATGANDADARLVQAAVEAVKQWKFKPVVKEGKAVEAKAKITFNFKLS
jgi:protein TonB